MKVRYLHSGPWADIAGPSLAEPSSYSCNGTVTIIHLYVIHCCFNNNKTKTLQQRLYGSQAHNTRRLAFTREKLLPSALDKQSKNTIKPVRLTWGVVFLYWSPPSITSLMIFPLRNSYSSGLRWMDSKALPQLEQWPLQLQRFMLNNVLENNFSKISNSKAQGNRNERQEN